METNVGAGSEVEVVRSPEVLSRGVSPVFLAKLRPPAAGRLIRRARLLDLLDDALRAPVVMVAAPAGSGKTSLLAGWAAERRPPPAWLSLDEWDRDPVRLWTGVLAAIDTIAPTATAGARAVLSQRGPIEEAVAALLVDLEHAAVEDAVLVLDDIHLVDDLPPTVRSITDLATYMPTGFHLVLIGRRRFGLPVDRLRARGRLGVLSFDELQFSPEEAARMLADLAPGLNPEQVAPTAERAAGWAANIQLSGLAARAARARAEEPTTREGDRLTEDYLWHEVLADESPETIGVLHAASLVERINGGLARSITGREDAEALLERAVERGLFLIRLSEPGWYTQHSLVRELLRRELGERRPEVLAGMHAGAARWYEATGEATLAVTHWLLADRPREALRAVAANNAALYDQGSESVVVRAISRLPADLVTSDVEAALDYAWAHVVVDRRVLLDTVDRITDLTEGQDLDPRTRGRILILRSVAASDRGEWEDTGTFARAALEQFGPAPWTDHLGRFGWNQVARRVALTETWSDDAAQVRRAAVMLKTDAQRRLAFEGTRSLGLALSGRPREALAVAADVGERVDVTRLSILSLELALAGAIARCDLGLREEALAELSTLVRRPLTPVPYVPFRAGLELAEHQIVAGHPEQAEQTLAATRALMKEDLAGRGARTWAGTVEVLLAIALGRPDRAADLAADIPDRVWAAIGLARARLARSDGPGALAVLEDVRPRSVRHEVLVDLLRARGAPADAEAVAAVRRAVRLAAEHDLVRPVAAECAHDRVPDLLERVADAVPRAWLDRVRRSAAASTAVGAALVPAGAHALTERERDVLRMLPSRLTVTEIAEELHLSRNTVKFHLKVIYRKLGCDSRAEAAAVARSLTRIDRPGRRT